MSAARCVAAAVAFALCPTFALAAPAEDSTGPFKVDYAFVEVPPTVKELRYAFACPDGHEIQMRWVAEDVGQAAPANFELAVVKVVTKGPFAIARFSRPTNGWPNGMYRLELRHAGKVFHQVRFVVDEEYYLKEGE